MSEGDLFGLSSAHVVITGASGGIGLETVKLFSELGARITAQRNSKTGGLQDHRSLHIIQADATSEQQVEKFYEVAEVFNGPPEVLVGIPLV